MTEPIIPIKGYSANLNLGKGRLLDCYELPDGEKRVGYEGASTVLGHAKNWLGRLPKNSKKLLQALQDEGWNGLPIEVQAAVRGTTTIAKTISVRDFIKLIGQEALLNRNPDAIVLLVAFAEVGIEKVISDLFTGHNTEYLLQKIEHYSTWTYEELEEVLKYNREEVRALKRW